MRVGVQRSRLFAAAAAVFARSGYADATAEGIAREAGMSKATFYEHFANKEECLLALFDAAATAILRAMNKGAGPREGVATYEEWVQRGLRAVLATLAAYPSETRTLLVEAIGAGPEAMDRRDAFLDAFAEVLYRDNVENAPAFGAPVFATPYDAFTVIGGVIEVVSRQLRTQQPPDIRDVEPTLLRLMLGVIAQARTPGLPPA
ncbi:TetR/AcrR family transcriptional regulator [Paraconexibacter sp. AEG42_29]|uniref:TetR/AcrR family transcriptional regulator n=1 Tax=Paraconexibacter sp. AEG42_29 TaxID=2997339 RepID=UPI00339D8561